MLVSDIIAKVRDEGGFDSSATGTSDTTILGWLNEKYRWMVAEAKWLKSVRMLSPISAGGTTYAIPEDVSDVRSVRIASGGSRYGLAQLEDLWALSADAAYVTPSGGGVFAANYESDTDPFIELWPATGGVDIEAIVSVIPSALGTSDSPKLPEDIQAHLVDGVIGVGLDRVYSRPDLASGKEASFQAGVQKLARRANSRVGSGPIMARIYGVNL